MKPQGKLETPVSTERKVTAWVAISLLYLAGCTTALHIGKIPVAIPLLQDIWQLSLTQSGLIISLHSILIASCGLMIGLIARRLVYAPFAILGVATVGAGSLLAHSPLQCPYYLLGDP